MGQTGKKVGKLKDYDVLIVGDEKGSPGLREATEKIDDAVYLDRTEDGKLLAEVFTAAGLKDAGGVLAVVGAKDEDTAQACAIDFVDGKVRINCPEVVIPVEDDAEPLAQ